MPILILFHAHPFRNISLLIDRECAGICEPFPFHFFPAQLPEFSKKTSPIFIRSQDTLLVVWVFFDIVPSINQRLAQMGEH